MTNQDRGVIYSLDRDELGQVFEIYSSVEGRQGTSAREPSRTLTPDLIRLFQKMQFETYRTDQIKVVASLNLRCLNGMQCQTSS